MSEKAIIRTSKTMILVFGLSFIGLLAGFYFNKVYKASADGPIDFVEHVVTNTPDRTTKIFAIDMDNDNDVDILGSSSYDNTIAWYENDGNQNFTKHVITNTALRASSVYAIDMDNDNDIDALSASSYDNIIAWYENDGNQNFTRHVISSLAAGAGSVYAIDIDNDNDIDVLGALSGWNDVVWYENNGNENFTTHVINGNANGINDVYAIDMDNDNDVDVLGALYFGDAVAWYENDGNETFTTHIITNNADGAQSVYAIDMNNDNDIDILSSSRFDDTIAWHENDGSENFTTHIITNAIDGPTSIYAIDVDHDNDIDVVSGAIDGDTIAWHENDGSENFTTHIITDAVNGAYSIYAIDIDNDNDIDILGGSVVERFVAWYENTMTIVPPTCNDGIQNGDETGVDCGGSCQYSCTVPVIVVHGWRQDVEDIAPLVENLDDRLDNNHPVSAFDYAPGQCSIDDRDACTIKDIKDYANLLRNEIISKRAYHNAKYVDLVGYSMGGVISRWHVQNSDLDHVRYLVQVASPNHGMPGILKFLVEHPSLAKKVLPDDEFPDDEIEIYSSASSTLQMKTHNTNFMKDLNGNIRDDYENGTDTVYTDVIYNIIGGTKANPPASGFISGEDDGVVSIKSLQIYNDHVQAPALGWYTHGEIYQDNLVAQTIANVLNDDYMPALPEAPARFSTSTPDYEDVQEINNIIDSVVGQKSHTIEIDSGAYVYFLMGYEGDDTDLIIEGPDNTIYNAEATGTARYLRIDNNLGGQWTLTASSTSSDYEIITFLATDIVLDSDIEYLVTPGQDVLISTSLTASSTLITGANVWVNIRDENGNQHHLDLVDQGDGTYSNTFHTSSNPSYYDVDITATATIADINITRNIYDYFEAIDYPDLTISDFTVTFDNANYQTELIATVENLENVAANDFTLAFYKDDAGYSTLIGELDFSLDPLAQTILTTTTIPTSGDNTYYAMILPYDNEDSYDNNQAQFSIYIPSKCSDGTNPNQCSQNKPFYCVDGELVNNCHVCGCPTSYKCSQATNMCVYYHQEPPIPMSMF